MSRESCHAIGRDGRQCVGGFEVHLESFNVIMTCDRCGCFYGYFRQQERWIILPAAEPPEHDRLG
jgi:hypothetical protein